jgi:hypothetical protein
VTQHTDAVAPVALAGGGHAGGHVPRALAAASAVVVLAVYASSVTPHWELGNDTGLYMNLARSLARGDGYTLAGEPHILVPPGYPAVLAAMMKAGAGSFLALNIAMAAIAAMCALAGWRLLAQLTSPGWALGVSLAAALSAEMVSLSGQLLSDLPFMLLVLGGLWMFYRGLKSPRAGAWWLAGSIAMSASVWLRVPGVALCAGAAAGLVWQAAGRRLKALAASLLMLALCAATIATFLHAQQSAGGGTYMSSLAYDARTSSTSELLMRPLENIWRTFGHVSRLLLSQRIRSALAMVLVAAPVLAGLLARMRRGDRLGPCFVLAYVSMVAAVELRTRYLVPLLPLLLLYCIEGYGLALGAAAQLTGRGRSRDGARLASMVMAVALGLMAAGNLVLVARDQARRHVDQYQTAQQGGKWASMVQAARSLAQRRHEGSLLGPQAVGYLADMPCILVPREVQLGGLRDPDMAIPAWLKRHNVHVALVDLRPAENDRPFYGQLRRYLSAHAELLGSWNGEVELYRLPWATGDALSQPTGEPP